MGFCSLSLFTALRSLMSDSFAVPRSASTATLTASSTRSGRNSCSGGSINLIVTGRASMAVRISVKSLRCKGMRACKAVSRSESSLARIKSSMSCRRSPRNMCSVRKSPIPLAPIRRARAASGPVSAFARTPIRLLLSAWAIKRSTAAISSAVSSSAPSSALRTPDSKRVTTGLSVTGTEPRNTSPVLPSIETTSPARRV